MLSSRHVPEGARAAYRLDRKGSVLAGIYTGAVFPFVGIIAREQLHAGGLELSILSAAPFLGFLLAIFCAGAVEGRQKIRTLVWALVLARCAVLLTAFAASPLLFIGLLSAAQLFGTLTGPATAALLKEIYPDDTRGRIMSYNRVALTAASALIALPAGWLLAHVGYRVLFPIAAAVGLCGALVYLRLEPLLKGRWNPTPPAESLAQRMSPAGLRRSAGGTFRFLASTFAIFREDVSYRWFALSVFTYGFGNLMLMPAYPIYQVDRLHISTTEMGWLSQVALITSIFAYFYWGRYVDLLSPLRAVAVNVLFNACIPLVYFFAAAGWHLIPAFVLTGMVGAGIDLAYFNAILNFADEESVARYQALHSFLLGIRGTLAPFAGVAIMEALQASGHDIKYLFIVSIVLMLAGCGMQAWGVRTRFSAPAGTAPTRRT